MPIYSLENLIPRRDWALVVCDERPKTVGGLFLPEQELGVEKVTERSGVVLRLGPGDKAATIDLKEGYHVVFRNFLKHAHPVPNEKNLEAFLMDVDDILAVTEGPVSVGAFSRPATSAVELVDEDGNVRMK
jgi:co-chaperonin GroES (HSP10)